MNIADRIQNLRKAKGISQEDLADKVGVSRQAVSKWESEQSVPDLDKIIIMSEYFDVTTATSGPEALAICSRLGCDIVLLDVMMPGMDGFEACRRLKRDPSTAHIPVVMVTALDQPADRLRGLEAGADDFLTKPIDEMTLIDRVR